MEENKANPYALTYAEGYSIDLYCDHINSSHSFDEFPHVYSTGTKAECWRKARQDGWIIHKNTTTATCPKCTKTKRKILQQ